MEDIDSVYVEWLKAHNFKPVPDGSFLLPTFQNDLINLKLKWK